MVQCIDCGFLCARSNDKAIREVDRDERTDPNANFLPLCLAMEVDLAGQVTPNSKTNFVITRPRDCPSFTTYFRGMSPQEHRQMIFTRELRKEDEERKERERQWMDRHKFYDRALTFLLAIFAGISGVIGYLIRDSMK